MILINNISCKESLYKFRLSIIYAVISVHCKENKNTRKNANTDHNNTNANITVTKKKKSL